jgi:hypothetical protein
MIECMIIVYTYDCILCLMHFVFVAFLGYAQASRCLSQVTPGRRRLSCTEIS